MLVCMYTYTLFVGIQLLRQNQCVTSSNSFCVLYLTLYNKVLRFIRSADKILKCGHSITLVRSTSLCYCLLCSTRCF